MQDYSAIIANNLIQLRKSRGLTQQDFAKVINYSDKTVSKWELGYAIPAVDTLKAIADYYGVSLDYFFEGHDDIPDNKLIFITLKTRRILLVTLFDLFFLLVSATIYAAIATAGHINYWPVFLWGIAAAAFFNGLLANTWWKYSILPYVFSSIAIWTTLVGIYFTILLANVSYNFWYLFFVGLPIQLATIIIITLSHSSTKK